MSRNFTFNLKKYWFTYAMMVIYTILGFSSVFSTNIANQLAFNKEAILSFEIYRFFTMYFVESNILSLLVTLYFIWWLGRFLQELISPLKLVLSFLGIFVISGITFMMIPVDISGLSSWFLFALYFFYVIVACMFLYNEEPLAKLMISRMMILILFQVWIIFSNGVAFILVNAVLFLAIAITLFILYYATTPKNGYSI